MSYSTQHYAVKRPSRRSLASSGIPDHSDVFAVYLRWVRQRYYQANGDVMQQSPPSSAASTRCSDDALDALHAPDALDEFHGHDSATPLANLQFDAERLSTDLLGTGAGFQCDDALVPRYPSELDLIG